MSPLRRFAVDLRLLTAVFALALLGWGFVWLSDEVTEGDTHAVDEWALKAFRHPDNPALPAGPGWVAEVSRDITSLGSVSVLAFFVALATVNLVMVRQGRAALVLVASSIGGALMSVLLKELIDRPRPKIVPHLTEVFSASFPSGHAMMSAVVYLTLGAVLARFTSSRRLRIYYLSVAFALTLLVGFSRVYLGVHYPSDVLAGWLAGISWALLVGLIVRALQRRGAVEQASSSNER